jgi:protein-S-isoprenylcysteine O-methyltransferase Ste14
MSDRKRLIAQATTILTFFVGLWLFFAPFAIGYQPTGHHWSEATRNSLWIGAGLVFFSGLTLILYWAFALRDASRAALVRQEAEGHDEGEEEPRQSESR